MKQRIISKGLAVSVILLFLGVGIQPAIEVTPDSSDSEGECNLCPKVSKQQLVRVKNLLNRLETPIVEEKYQELSESIILLKELNKDLELDKPMDDYPYPIVCNILAVFVIMMVLWLTFIASWIMSFAPFEWAPFLGTLVFIGVAILSPFWHLYWNHCEEWNPY